MGARNIGLLLVKDLRDAWRNRWFLLYSAAFAVLALAMSWIGLVGAAGSGFAGLGRTAASLINLVVLVVPLMGLTLGAAAIAPERERGSLLYLLAQPVDKSEVVLGKFFGLAAAVSASLLLGFGVAALAIARRSGSGQTAAFLLFLALSLLLATASVSLGMAISALARRGSVASGIAVFGWLLLVLLGDLGLIGTSLVARLGTRELLALALVNPLQEYKLAALLVMRGGLESLGPAGLYATRALGAALLPALAGGLLLWTAVPLAITAVTIHRRGGL